MKIFEKPVKNSNKYKVKEKPTNKIQQQDITHRKDQRLLENGNDGNYFSEMGSQEFGNPNHVCGKDS